MSGGFPWCTACPDWRACALLSAKTDAERRAIEAADEPGSESEDLMEETWTDPNMVGA